MKSTEYDRFTALLMEELIKTAGVSEKQLQFRRKGEKGAETEDRLYIECGRDGNAVQYCGVYLEELFRKYQKGETLKAIAKAVCERVFTMKDLKLDGLPEKLKCYPLVKNSLFIRTLNYARNEEKLEKMIFKRVGDIALVLYIQVADLEDEQMSMKIPAEIALGWGLSIEEVFQDALLNTYFLSPPRMYEWERLLFDKNYKGDNFMDLLHESRISRNPCGNCISTEKKVNGAVSIFLPGVARRLAEVLDDDLYLSFTSVHEVMVHSANFSDLQTLKTVLTETISETTPEEDFLSEMVYRYDKHSGEYTIVM